MEYGSQQEFMDRMARTNFLRNRHEHNVEYAARLIGPPEADGGVRLKLTPTAHRLTMQSMIDADLSGYLPQITCPTRIIRATEGNLTEWILEQMLAAIPDCDAVAIEGSNHNVLLDKPEAFDAALDPFLERAFA